MQYREEPCKTALNPVKGMPFAWSLNPYMGCVHRCTFCYVRAFERRADRPSGDGYGLSIRVKVNIADVLRMELARKSWRGGSIAIGAATDPYQPAEGRYRLTRGCLEALAAVSNPFHIVTRGPLIVRDVDVLAEAAGRAQVSVSFSVPTLDEHVWRRTEPGTAPPRQRLRALSVLREAESRRRRRRRAGPPGHLRPAGAARGGRPRGAPPVPTTSGRVSSTCDPGRASTSSSISPRTGPSWRRSTSASTGTRYPRARSSSVA